MVWAWNKGFTRDPEDHELSENILAGIHRFRATFGILFENYKESAFFYGLIDSSAFPGIDFLSEL